MHRATVSFSRGAFADDSQQIAHSDITSDRLVTAPGPAVDMPGVSSSFTRMESYGDRSLQHWILQRQHVESFLPFIRCIVKQPILEYHLFWSTAVRPNARSPSEPMVVRTPVRAWMIAEVARRKLGSIATPLYFLHSNRRCARSGRRPTSIVWAG